MKEGIPTRSQHRTSRCAERCANKEEEEVMRIKLLTAVYAATTVLALAATTMAQTQADMQDEACAEFKKADDALNKIYKKILTDYKDEKAFLEKLKKAQRAWLAYRDAHLEAIYPEKDKSYYGSVFGMCACSDQKELTEQRTKDLKKWVDGVMEGESCRGSIKIQEARDTDAPVSLIAAIQAYIKKIPRHSERSQFDYALTDLNGDGTPDAIVLLNGPEWCGSGGCTLLIFKGKRDGFEFKSKSTITSHIRVSPELRHGWKTLIVYTGGVGDVVMPFNGTRYPANPSTQPKATKAQAKAAETVLK
jgi:uncharacterized protein YecT (DUF1311 family)